LNSNFLNQTNSAFNAQNDDFKEIDELEVDDLKDAKVLEGILGKKMVLKLYSKYPEHREKALEDLNKGLYKFPFMNIDKADRQGIFVSLFAVITKGINDGNNDVNMRAITLLLDMMETH
jgi:hypothetical protein